MVTLSRLGVDNGVTNGSFAQDNALFLKVFGGEILTAFNAENKFLDKHMLRTIQSGKSAQFPVTGKATAKYHSPGTGTHDNAEALKQAERVINIDDLLYANTIIYNLDELKNHYDVRAEMAKQLGEALSAEFDKKIARVILNAARASATLTGNPGGSILNKGATVETDASVLAAALFEAAEALDTKNVPTTERYAAVRPAQYYQLVQNTDVINKDWGGNGSYAEGNVRMVGGLPLVKTNHLPNTNITAATAGENNTYTGNFTNTVAAVWHKSAAGTVRLKDLTTEMTGQDFRVMYQGDMLLAKYAMGHGVLRPECSVEISKTAA